MKRKGCAQILVASSRVIIDANLVQSLLNVGKIGSLLWFPVPALGHQVVQHEGSVFRTTQHIAVFYEFYNLFMSHSKVRLHGEREDLPKTHTESPNVALNGVLVVENALEWHPTNWYCILLSSFVVVLHVDFVRQSEICELKMPCMSCSRK